MKIINYKRINGLNNSHQYIPLSQKQFLNNHSKNKNRCKNETKCPFDYINNLNINFERFGKANNFNLSENNKRLVNNFDRDENQPLSQYNMSTENYGKKNNYIKIINHKINLTSGNNNYRIINNKIMDNSYNLFSKSNYRLYKSFKPEMLYTKDIMNNNSNIYSRTSYNPIDNLRILEINKKPIINKLLINDNYFNRKINYKKINRKKNNVINISEDNYLEVKNAPKNNYNPHDYFTIQSQKDIKKRNLKKYIGTISNNNLINKKQNFNELLYINKFSNFNINPLK